MDRNRIITCINGWTVANDITASEVCAQLRKRAEDLESGKLQFNLAVSVAEVRGEGSTEVTLMPLPTKDA